MTETNEADGTANTANEPIHFYRTSDEYGAFSNFAAYAIRMEGKTWPTTEHYFQAMKFTDPEEQEAIRKAKTPAIAARMGRSRKRTLRRGWDSARVNVMRTALRAKFTTHDDLRELLLGTGDAPIVEHTEKDCFWGDGGDGSGRNMLGRLLMEIRDEIRVADE